jgi:hypothetical protein
MDWVERRFVFENNLKATWLALQTEIGTAINTFDNRYTSPQRAEINKTPNSPTAWCITITYTPVASGISRSIQICLDLKGKRVYSSIEGTETDVLYLGFDVDGNAFLVDKDSAIMENDRASQILLEPFLFPDSKAAPHVRFPVIPAKEL